MKRSERGDLITHGVMIEKHELRTIMFYVEKGEVIELIRPSNTPLNKNADFIMNHMVWEMKCPMGKSLTTLQHLFRKASKQAENIIFDLRYFKGNEKVAVRFLNKLFSESRKVRKLHIILRSERLIEGKS